MESGKTMDLNKVIGKQLPLNKSDFAYEEWMLLTSSLGQASLELIDMANALESQNMDWVKSNQSGLPVYYEDLANKLVKIQQALFGYNVTGKEVGNEI